MAECHGELRAVLASRSFQQSQTLARLLQYVCTKAVLGEADQITEYTIAVDVFGKPQGFRESKDSIVRVEVHRLRKRLTAYYARDGADHKVRIVIPPGSYAPDFQTSTAPDPVEEPAVAEPAPNGHPPALAPPVASPPVEVEEVRTAPEPPLATQPPFYRKRSLLVGAGLLAAVGILWLAFPGVRSWTTGRGSPRPVPFVNTEVHILAGYTGEPWTDGAGRQWQPDRYFRGGVARPGPRHLGSAPPDRRLFQNIREGTDDEDLPEDRRAFFYDIPMQPGTYEMRLYFADPLRESPHLEDSEDGENVRRFTVAANGRTLLEQFDAVSDAGYGDVDVRAFKDIVPGRDGKVHLQFTPGQQRPFVSAIELVPARPGHANTIRFSAHRTMQTDPEGRTWEPDNYYVRGRQYRHPMPEAARDLPEVFREERYGNFSYSIPVPPGSYTVTLYFAETMFTPSAASAVCRGPGCRLFSVTCNGVELLHDLDVFSDAGGAYRLLTRTFHGLRPNGQGKLLLSFSPSINYAEVRAVEVVDEAP